MDRLKFIDTPGFIGYSSSSGREIRPYPPVLFESGMILI